MRVRTITSLLVVEAIEPLLPHWQEACGMRLSARADEGATLGFALLGADDGAQLMLQTRESLATDLPAVAAGAPASLLYIDVDSIDAAAAQLAPSAILVPLRTTFYGAREIWVQDASGAIIGYAESPA